MEKGSKNINFGRFFLGFLVALIGLIILLRSFDVYIFNFDFCNLIPLFFIFLGLSFLTGENRFSLLVGSLTTVVAIILIMISLFNYTNMAKAQQSFTYPLSLPLDASANQATVRINNGLGSLSVYTLTDGQNNLASGRVTTKQVAFNVDSSTSEGNQQVVLNLEKGLAGVSNDIYIGLNKTLPMQVFINSSAADNKIDFSEISLAKADIKTATSHIDLKMGNLANRADISIEANKSSSINLLLPADVGIELLTSSNMNSRDLFGLKLYGRGVYKSENYDASAKKIVINVKTSISSISIDWYDPGVKKSEIDLFYYNPTNDKDKACTSEYVFPLMRETTLSDDPIKDSINFLLEGKLTSQEKADGFYPYLPNNNFKLLNSSLDDDGTLTLTFSEVPDFTGGNRCRSNILSLEIAKTAKQFPEVKKVVFEPASLFE